MYFFKRKIEKVLRCISSPEHVIFLELPFQINYLILSMGLCQNHLVTIDNIIVRSIFIPLNFPSYFLKFLILDPLLAPNKWNLSISIFFMMMIWNNNNHIKFFLPYLQENHHPFKFAISNPFKIWYANKDK